LEAEIAKRQLAPPEEDVGENAYDSSGHSVAVSEDGKRVVIGAHNNDGNGSNSGRVWVFDWIDSTWTQVGLDIDGETAGVNSGFSVAVSEDGKRIAISAPHNDGNSQSSGHVWVFEWIDSTWTQVGLDSDGETAGDNSGFSVAVSEDGKRIAISAPYNDGNSHSVFDWIVSTFDWIDSTWTHASEPEPTVSPSSSSSPSRAPSAEPSVSPSVEFSSKMLVEQFYCRVLQRPPESDEAIAGWLDYLKSNTVKGMVRLGILGDEFNVKFVNEKSDETLARTLYDVLLARAGDADGLVNWEKEVGLFGWEKVADRILASDEYNNRFGDDAVPGAGREGCF
jgi:hypothetical protein